MKELKAIIVNGLNETFGKENWKQIEGNIIEANGEKCAVHANNGFLQFGKTTVMGFEENTIKYAIYCSFLTNKGDSDDPREEGVKWAYISRRTFEDVTARHPQGTKEFEENLPFLPFDEFVKEIPA